MKGKIDKEGTLVINGNSKICPFNKDMEFCGDWCALFGEPELDRGFDDLPSKVILKLCHKVLIFNIEDFTDERGK